MDLDKTGKFIAERRKKLRLTQEELGEKINVSPKTISKWERGVNAPDISILTILARELKTSVEEILEGESIQYKYFKNLDKLKNFIMENVNKKYVKLAIKIFFIVIVIILIFSYFKKINEINVYYFDTFDKNYTVKGHIIVDEDNYIIDISEVNKKIKNRKIDNEIKNVTNMEVYLTQDDETLCSINITANEDEFLNFYDKLININLKCEENIEDINMKSDFALNIRYKIKNEDEPKIYIIKLSVKSNK